MIFSLTAASFAHSAEDELSRYQAAEKLAKIHVAKLMRWTSMSSPIRSGNDCMKVTLTMLQCTGPMATRTNGIEKHIEDLKAMFIYAPDTRIQEHPVKVAQGEWTSVVGIMEALFTHLCR